MFVEENEGYISPERQCPEITLRAVLLAILLTVLMSSSTVYLGLKVGMTLSASIPAAVIAMGILGVFKNSNVLENNIVQTTASGGMSLASGVIFCLPALVILEVWQDFYFWETCLISFYGGLLGVLFSVPFRKILISDSTLKFPEGTAVGFVLKAKVAYGRRLNHMIWGAVVGALMSIAQMGFKLVAEGVDLWMRFGKTVAGISLGFSPVMLGAGYIVGGRVAWVLLLGIVMGWVIGVPLSGVFYGLPEADGLMTAVMHLWSYHVRYIGVGALMMGGVWTFLVLAFPKICGLRFKQRTDQPQKRLEKAILRTERDIPLRWVMAGYVLIAIPLYFIYGEVILNSQVSLPKIELIGIDCLMVIYTVIIGFVLAYVCGYIGGMVGSSVSPISALALGSILIISLILFAVLGGHAVFQESPEKALAGSTMAIVIGVVVICAFAVSNDSIQDLKVGHMVGATPWKQQLMQMVGIFVASIVIPPMLHLLFQAYGIAGVFPREGMDPRLGLPAPQAQLMAALAKGVFDKDIPWGLTGVGAVIAIAMIALDMISRKFKKGPIPVIAVGLGIYLPISVSTPLVLGGIASFLAQRKIRKRCEGEKNSEELIEQHQQNGFILASGIIAGGATVGILVAIPFVVTEDTNVLAIVGHGFESTAGVIGIVMACLLLGWMYRLTCQSLDEKHH